jgi:hypothetical protein
MVCKPKDMGGLGVVDLQDSKYRMIALSWSTWTSFSTDLHGCILDGRNIGSALPFWWRDCLKLLPKFKGIASCSLHNGTTTLRLQDTWEHQSLQDNSPQLATFSLICRSHAKLLFSRSHF